MPNAHIVPLTSLDGLGPALDGLPDDDVVLTHPVTALVAAEPEAVEAAADLFEGAVAIAASAVPLGPPGSTAALEKALLSQLGEVPYRAYPHPLGLCGPVGALRQLLKVLPAGGDDTERIIGLLLGGGADVAVDSAGQIFRVLDGTGADVVAVAGRFHAGGEQPLVAVGAPRELEALRAALADPGARDLAALLRYDGAIDPSPRGLTVVADEILVMPFWTEAFCAAIIRAAEAAGVWGADPDDPVPGSEVSLYAISPRLVGLLEEDLHTRAWPAWKSHWGEAAQTGILDAFVIRYEPGGGAGPDELPLHHDVAQISGTIKLNAGYGGGALSFPRQAWDTAGVPVGHLVAWPSLVTHPHRGEPVAAGVKYGLTVWMRLPETG